MNEGRIPQSFIDEVLQRTDIVDLIDARVKLKRAGKNYTACCPFHQEKSPSFTVNREKQFYYCFGCGASGNALSFLMNHERQEFIDALKQLASQVGLTVPETRAEGRVAAVNVQQPLFDILEAAAQHFERQLRQSSEAPRAVAYLKKRGLTGAIAKHFRLGFAPPGWDVLLNTLGATPADRARLVEVGLCVQHAERDRTYDALRDRIIFPIRDFRGRVIGFGGRVLGDEKPKYLNSPESPVFHKGNELYGLYEARQSGKVTRLMVVEGYMDVVMLAQHGITEAVATLGTATSTTHIERLLRVVDDLVFCFDGDAAGRRAAWRALESALPALRDGARLSFLFLPDGEDPDSLVQREGADLFRARVQADAVPLSRFLFQHLAADLITDTAEGRAEWARRALPLLALIPEQTMVRDLLLDECAEHTHLPRSRLEAQLARVRPAVPVGAPPSAAPATAPATVSLTGAAAPATATAAQTVPRAPSRRAMPAPRSLSAQVIALLLQQPTLSQIWPRHELEDLDEAETPLLLAVFDALASQPDCRLATLLGQWQGSALGAGLAAIAAEDDLVPPEANERVLADMRRQLQRRQLEREIHALSARLSEQPDRDILVALAQAQQRLLQLRQAPTDR